ncbi:ribbon-helix-helix protein, CopG family [Sneathiella chungangensis]|uniref:Ribbon-helix-helix protein, CopG family n=1 Tax=Sneathiella chungangensis TaxID=1418234 RepID=A0A845MKQ9_9PROT|nr:ribbon-helix-helix protein, CopG family [Sneathiella chungangensis]
MREKATFDRHMHLCFTPQLAERAQRHAARQDMSLSEFIRQAIRQHLDNAEQAA